MRSGRDRVPFEIGASCRVDHMDECVCLPKVVEELVAQPAPFMRLRDEASDIEQFDGDEASPSLTRCVVRLTGTAELFVGTSLPNEGYPSVRLNCGEWIVCD